jgi:hypothetical protein
MLVSIEFETPGAGGVYTKHIMKNEILVSVQYRPHEIQTELYQAS